MWYSTLSWRFTSWRSLTPTNTYYGHHSVAWQQSVEQTMNFVIITPLTYTHIKQPLTATSLLPICGIQVIELKQAIVREIWKCTLSTDHCIWPLSDVHSTNVLQSIMGCPDVYFNTQRSCSESQCGTLQEPGHHRLSFIKVPPNIFILYLYLFISTCTCI